MQEETAKRTTKKNHNNKYRIYAIALAAVVVLAGGMYFGWTKYQAYQNSPEVQTAKAEEEKKEIMEAISKFMLLPEGDPVLFRVSNKDQMRAQQAFFKDTENDDVLLVFQQAGKAIIFRPSNNTIINVGPVNFDNTQVPNQTRPAGNTSTSTKK